MMKLVCPQCGVPNFYVKNADGERLNVYVTDEYKVVPKNLDDSLEGFDLDTVYCLVCSWSGSPKKLVKP